MRITEQQYFELLNRKKRFKKRVEDLTEKKSTEGLTVKSTDNLSEKSAEKPVSRVEKKNKSLGSVLISEHEEQANLIGWCRLNEYRLPGLELIFAIPNGGHRIKIIAKRMKAEGVKAGVLDLCLPVARRGFHGLFIEMKTAQGRPSKAQKWWMERLKAEGYHVEVCKGFDEGRKVLEWYLGE